MKKTILSLSIVAGLLLSCNSDDDANNPQTQACETTDLQLTQANANPRPELINDEMYSFTDWSWTMNEEEQELILKGILKNIIFTFQPKIIA